LGSIYLGPESGIQWDTKRVCIDDGCWERAGIAQNEVSIPAGRPCQLIVMMALEPRQAASLRRQNPFRYSNLVLDRPLVDPYDLSGLSTLGPNDLDVLTVNALPGSTNADQRVLGKISHLKGLRLLRLHDTGISDKGMEHLRSLSSLQGLELAGERSVTYRGLAVLKDLPLLRYLYIEMGGLTDVGLKQIGGLSRLQWLRISTEKIWGSGLAALAHLTRLERLCLQGQSQLSDRHIQYLEGLQHLKSLTLWGGCERLTDRSLVSISTLTSLEELYFIRTAPRFTPKGIASLKGLKHLRIVDFGHAMVGDEGVRQLAAAVPQLESIEGGLCVTAAGMKALGTMQNLNCLRIGLKEPLQGYHGPTGISHLAGLGSLEELALSGGDPSDEDLMFLEGLTSLKHLCVSGQGITERGLQSIAKLTHLETLDLYVNATKQGLNQLSELKDLRQLKAMINSDMRGVHDESTLNLSSLRQLKSLRLSGLSLHEADLVFLSHVKNLESLTIETPSLSADALQHIKPLGRLKRLDVYGLVCTKDDGLLPLNGLSGLYDVKLNGKISDASLGSLADLENIWGLTIQTNEPIRRQTKNDLSRRLSGIEYLHIYELPKVPTRSTQRRKPTNVSRPRANRRAPTKRRR